MAGYLPSAPGWLPYFLLYTGSSALIHSIVCYLQPPSVALVQFSGSRSPPPTALLAHTYGVKNLYTGLIRLYAAYHLDNPELYSLAMCTFVGVLLLYAGEYFIWKTSGLRKAMFPFVTAGSGLLWMLLQRNWYLS